MNKLLLLVCFGSVWLSAQEMSTTNDDTTRTPLENTSLNLNDEYIETATDFLDRMADVYGNVSDIVADISIINSETKFNGTIFVKSPNLMRINFINPRGQVINNNGQDFYIYIHAQNVALHQKKKSISEANADVFLTKNGLHLLSKNYLISYLDKPEFILFKSNPQIKILKLKLTWKNTSQNFRELVLFVGENFLIHKVEAISYNREKLSFSFSNFEINKGIPLSRFEYDPPPTAHVIDDFLFNEQ